MTLTLWLLLGQAVFILLSPVVIALTTYYDWRQDELLP